MIIYRRFKEPSLRTLKRHLSKFNSIRISSDAAIEDQPDKCLLGVDVGMELFQPFSQRLYRIFVQGPKAFFECLTNASWKYPKGRLIKSKDSFDSELLGDPSYIYRKSWSSAFREGLTDLSFHYKEAFKTFCWVDWVITLDGQDIIEAYRQEEKELGEGPFEKQIWVHDCDIDKFTSYDQIVHYTKEWILKVYGRSPDITYFDGREELEIEIPQDVLELLEKEAENKGLSLNGLVNDLLKSYIEEKK